MAENKGKNLELINVRKVLKDKNPGLYKIIPEFLIQYLRRIVHEESINDFLIREDGNSGFPFVDAILNEFKVKAKVHGLENIPEDGRYLIASNHPLGGLDGIALIQSIGKVRNDVLFPVNDILMNVAGLKEFFIPVNKHGSNADNIKALNNAFESDNALLYFPAGLVSRKQKGVVKDLEWKKTFVTKCKRYKRDIIPAFITGHNSNFFYRLANLRKSLGLKANIEMLYLVDEFYKQQGQTFEIYFGKPIPYSMFDKRHSDKQWASMLREHIYQIEKDKNKAFCV